MSKIKFGNFITYKGKNIATPKAKAVKGNLVFAEITEGADKGYYIFGGVAEGHLVTMDVFNALKKEVNELAGAGELAMPKHEDGSYYSIVEYVNGRLADYKVKDVKVGNTSIAIDGVVTLGNAAQRDVATEIALGNTGLATSDQVQSAINSALTGENVQIEGYNVKDITIAGVTTTKSKDGVVDLGAAAGYGVATEIVDGGTGLVTADQVYDKIQAIPTYGVSGSANISVTPSVADGKHNFTVDITDKVATKDYVDDKVGKLGDVMSFIGVVSTVPTDKNVTLSDGKTVEATPGDVVTIASTDEKSGTEYVWTGSTWVEIGRVAADEAVTSLGEVKGDIALGEHVYIFNNTLDADVYQSHQAIKVEVDPTKTHAYDIKLKIDETNPGNVTLTQSGDGLKAEVGADDLAYTNAKAGATVADVKGALDELYDDKEVVAQALVDLKSGISGLDTRLETVETKYVSTITPDEKSSSYIEFKKDENDTTLYHVNLTIASGDSGSTGLVSMDTLESWVNDSRNSLIAHVGSTQAHAAENITFAGATGATATNVEAALDELYAKVADAAKSGDAINITYAGATGATATNVEAALDELYAQIATLDGAVVKDVQGDTASYSQVVQSEEDEQVKIVKNVLADNVVGEDGITTRVHGLVTDEYLDEVLAWEDITD